MKIRINRYTRKVGYEYHAECLKDQYESYTNDIILQGEGTTPEQAVANLFLTIIRNRTKYLCVPEINFSTLDIIYNYKRVNEKHEEEIIKILNGLNDVEQYTKEQKLKSIERQTSILLELQKQLLPKLRKDIDSKPLSDILDNPKHVQELRIETGKKASTEGLNPSWKFAYQQLEYALDHLFMLIDRTTVEEL